MPLSDSLLRMKAKQEQAATRQQHETTDSSLSKPTVISIRSNHDFTIINSETRSSQVAEPASGSAFVSLGQSRTVETDADQLSKVTTSNKSISSSSQGISPFSITSSCNLSTTNHNNQWESFA